MVTAGNSPVVWMFTCLSPDAAKQYLIVQVDGPTDSMYSVNLPSDSVEAVNLSSVYPTIFRDVKCMFPTFRGDGDPVDGVDSEVGPLCEQKSRQIVAYSFLANATKRLFIPRVLSTTGAEMINRNYMIYTLEGIGKIMSDVPRIPTAIRWDILSTRGIIIPETQSIQRVSVGFNEGPFIDLYLQTKYTPRLEADTEGSIGNDGCLFKDKTRLGIIRFEHINESTFIVINGSILGTDNKPTLWGGSSTSEISVSEMNDYPYLLVRDGDIKFIVDTRNVERIEGIGRIMRYDTAETYPIAIQQAALYEPHRR